ncbi:nucleolar DEAD-box protein required for synthesis of 60S ribosomal subunit [Microbotryomycetes sp. JL201]|nr:nucleolar DEAD-box protein required for synthesis of 60S ribosomal subunit [Microbotryomycetes sp. JL201]
MADLIMTMSSDDEQSPEQRPAFARPSNAAARTQQHANGSSTQPKKTTKQAKKKSKQAMKQAKQRGKRSIDDVSADEQDDEDEPHEEQDDGAMSKAFVFDGLGGGYVGSRRNDVWDGGDKYLVKRPNAMPRVTVDEIIARRAPIRATQGTPGDKDNSDDDADEFQGTDLEDNDDEANSLEEEMMAELEEEFGGIDSDANEAQSDGAEGSDDESQTGSAADDAAGDSPDRQAEVDDEDWLELGGGDTQPTSDVDESGKRKDDILDAGRKLRGFSTGPTGFAALAELGDDLMDEQVGQSDLDSSDDNDDQDAQTRANAKAAKAFFTSHSNTNSAVESFTTLPGCTLSRQLLLALSSLNLSKPTPIQRECIPVAMMGKDIVASSATGSGKTVAFWVGVLERLLHRDRKNPATRVVVMTPTRELAVQVHGVGQALARYTDIQFCLCVGGLSLKVQEAELKQRPDVVVSTPGRLIDHVRNTPSFTMDAVEILVLDEADRMLEEGFKDELEEIITAAPRSRQTLLFSATVTESVASLSRLSMNKPVRVKIDEMGATASGLVQEFLRVRGDKAGEAIERGRRSGERHREALLMSLCTRSFSAGRTIIFFRSKAQAHRMKILFTLYGQGLERSDELHGDLTQEQRLTSLRRFREGESAFLLATDLASRGLDIKGIENVINYEMPKSIEIYLHRVGRTARAGKKGRALTLVGEEDRKLVKLAMKHAPPESIKQRSVPVDVVSATAKQLQALESEVKEVEREEKEEKAYRRGDMEITKARNMIEHEAEIKARPARTWFQTAQEKKIAKGLGVTEHNSKFTDKKGKKRAAPEEDAKPAPKRTPFSGLSRKEKRRKMAAMEDAQEREEGSASKINSSIRAAKKAAMPRKMTAVKQAGDGPGAGSKRKKGKKGGKFDREIGQAGGGKNRA